METTVKQTRCGHNGTVFVIRRFFCRWDTSELTADATITDADIKLFVTARVNGSTTGIDIVQSTATDGVLATTDYDNLGTTVYETLALASMTDAAYNTWPTLSTAGLADISKTANTKFAWRVVLDTTNTAPGSSIDNSMDIQQSGDANPEQLVVTYTTSNRGYAFVI